MKKSVNPIMVIIALAVGIVLLSSVYIVDETNQVVVTRFGDPIGDPVTQPGVHIKMPFIEKCNVFDKRLLEWDGDPNRIPTQDKKYIWIDTTARWRIKNALMFLQTVHDERGAQSRLDDILDGATRNVIAKHALLEIVRNSNKILNAQQSDDDKLIERTYDSIAEGTGRDVVMREMLQRAIPKVEEYGIELVDIRIKRINYDAQVRTKVFERMISERKRAAELLRAQGLGERAEIEGKTQKELERIQSNAYREAEIIHGKADAEATRIYAEAYSQDPDYYAFLNTLAGYNEAFASETMIMLSTDSEYLKYLNSTTGE